ncbi:MAG TPA: cytochrome P450 [Actinomycetota bacterium]|nr:cytochrome P450 [Actinomycetota bacterium]
MTVRKDPPAVVAGLDETFANDPYPLYARLRRDAPVYRTPLPDGSTAWLVTRYADVRAALADTRLSKDAQTAERARATRPSPGAAAAKDGEAASLLGAHMLSVDPPEHTRLRKLVNTAFTTRQVERLRATIQETADALLDVIAPLGEADLIEAFALPLPVTVICELLGFVPEDSEQVRSLLTAMIAPEGGDEASRAAKELAGHLLQRIADKRRHPGDDLLSELVRVHTGDADRLSEAELVSMALILLEAGHETTVNLIGNGTLALLLHPDQMALLRSDPARLAAAIEELLRYESPLTIATPRFTVEETEIGGVQIPAGELVLAAIGSADRDPERFADPDRLDITRDHCGHLAFGHGIHYCVGAPLARLEGEIAFATLLRRLPGLRLAVPLDRVRWRPPCVNLRGLAELPVRFTPQPRAGACAPPDGRQ